MTAMTLDVLQKTAKLMNFRNKLLQLKLRAFKPKILFKIEIGDYIVKTAETTEELEQILKLRYQVFIREGLKKRKLMGVDFDRYDLLADHVLVLEKSTNTTIGTYRMLCSKFTDDFYSSNEFKLQNFLNTPGIKLELGRACIHRFHRNGTTINLVWKGIGAYANAVGADFLFGCASVKTIDAEVSQKLFEHLAQHRSDDYKIEPTPEFSFKKPKNSKKLAKETPQIFEAKELEEMIPPLLKTYIKAGIKVHGPAAVDYDFDCIDFLVILNLHTINERFKARYFDE